MENWFLEEKDEKKRVPLSAKLADFAEVVLYGLLWVLLCIPIVTIGASTAAMYKMLFDKRREKPCKVKNFFEAFKGSFKNSTIILAINIASGAAIVGLAYLIFTIQMSGMLKLVLCIPLIMIMFVWCIIFSYAYPYTAFFDQKIGLTLYNSMMMGLGNMGHTLIEMAWTLVFAAILIVFGAKIFVILIPTMLFVLLPFVAWKKSYHFFEIFKLYLDEYKDKVQEIEK